MAEPVAPAASNARSDGQTSQTAADYIASQLQLEAEAREALPYQFNACTKPLGPLRQSVFACLTCTPPPATARQSFAPAGICYSCSISCHGEHRLVELFAKRDFECDCGTSRFRNGAPCVLRRAVSGEETAREGNVYNQNYRGRFCGCGDEYDVESEKGTMFQCLGLGTAVGVGVEVGREEGAGCGEDWWHPECLMGLPRPRHAAPKREGTGGALETVQEEGEGEGEGGAHEDEPPLPEGFPAEDDFEALICYKCADAFPWIKQYAGTPGFLPAVSAEGRPHADGTDQDAASASPGSKRKADDGADDARDTKKVKTDRGHASETTPPPNGNTAAAVDTPAQSAPASQQANDASTSSPAPLHTRLPPAPAGRVSLFLKEDFRAHLCRCPTCFPRLAKHPPLLEEEETYEPPLSETASHPGSVGGQSVNSGSLLERGEAALSSMDRVKAIEGVMAYNHVKDKVKEFLRPFAEEGRVVSAEEIRGYFARLRGDEELARAESGSAGRPE